MSSADSDRSSFVDFLRQDLDRASENYWFTLQRYAVVVVILTVAPYLRPEIIKQIQDATLFTPFIAMVVAAFGSIHLAGFSKRVEVLRKKYHDELRSYKPTWTRESKKSNRLRDVHLEVVATRVLFYGTAVLSILSGYILWRVVKSSMEAIAASIVRGANSPSQAAGDSTRAIRDGTTPLQQFIFGGELWWILIVVGVIVLIGLTFIWKFAPDDPAVTS